MEDPFLHAFNYMTIDLLVISCPFACLVVNTLSR